MINMNYYYLYMNYLIIISHSGQEPIAGKKRVRRGREPQHIYSGLSFGPRFPRVKAREVKSLGFSVKR